MRTRILPALLLGQLASAAQYRPNELCAQGCRNSVALNFTGAPTANYSSNYPECSRSLQQRSLFICVRVYCQAAHVEPGLDVINRTCTTWGSSALPPFSIIEDTTDEDIRKLRVVEPADLFMRESINEVVLPSQIVFTRWFETLNCWEYVADRHLGYSYACNIFWAVVVCIGMVTRFVPRLSRKPLHKSDLHAAEPVESYQRHLLSKLHDFLKSELLVPAVFNGRSAQPIGWCTVPPRVESLTILAFILLNFYFCIAGYRTFEGNFYWPEIRTQLGRYVADRTGILSFANLPLVWLFASRNNILLWLTGWSYATYNSFHRWAARVATVQAVVHSIAYTWLIMRKSSIHDALAQLWEYFMRTYFWNGEIATVAMVFICVFSVYGMRQHYYETFLILHIILSTIFLITALIHVLPFGRPYDFVIFACIVLWISDRLFRLGRLVFLNLAFWNATTTTNYSPDSNMVRLVFSPSRPLPRPAPGAFYYIYVLGGPHALRENHPFTLAAYTPPESDARAPLDPDDERRSLVSSPDPDLLIDAENADSRSFEMTRSRRSSFASRERPPDRAKLTFLIRPYAGFTASLRNPKRPPRILIEGPYGSQLPLASFSTVLFVAGGSGIAVPLPYIHALLAATQRSRRPDIVLLWVAREEAFIVDVFEHELRGILRREEISVRVFVTGGEADKAVDHIAGAYGANVAVRSGRPDVRSVLEEVAAERERGGKMAVVSAGPPLLVDGVRRNVVGLLREAKGEGVQYFQESFAW